MKAHGPGGSRRVTINGAPPGGELGRSGGRQRSCRVRTRVEPADRPSAHRQYTSRYARRVTDRAPVVRARPAGRRLAHVWVGSLRAPESSARTVAAVPDVLRALGPVEDLPANECVVPPRGRGRAPRPERDTSNAAGAPAARAAFRQASASGIAVGPSKSAASQQQQRSPSSSGYKPSSSCCGPMPSSGSTSWRRRRLRVRRWVGTWPRLSRESFDGVSNLTSATPQGAADATGALCQGDPAAADRGFLRTVCGQLANTSRKDLA
jgi:hypothetical protein